MQRAAERSRVRDGAWSQEAMSSPLPCSSLPGTGLCIYPVASWFFSPNIGWCWVPTFIPRICSYSLFSHRSVASLFSSWWLSCIYSCSPNPLKACPPKRNSPLWVLSKVGLIFPAIFWPPTVPQSAVGLQSQPDQITRFFAASIIWLFPVYLFSKHFYSASYLLGCVLKSLQILTHLTLISWLRKLSQSPSFLAGSGWWVSYKANACLLQYLLHCCFGPPTQHKMILQTTEPIL